MIPIPVGLVVDILFRAGTNTGSGDGGVITGSQHPLTLHLPDVVQLQEKKTVSSIT